MTELIIGIGIGFIVFLLGLIAGMLMTLYSHKAGVKLVDRISHDLTPFDDSEDEEFIQTKTDGTYLPIED